MNNKSCILGNAKWGNEVLDFVCLFVVVFCLQRENLEDEVCNGGLLNFLAVVSLTCISVRRPRLFSSGGQRRERKEPSLWR